MRERLESTDNAVLKNAKINVEEVSKIVSSLRGIMLGMTFGTEAYGRIRVDFEEDATPLADIAKPLLLQALANHGAMIDELEDWKAETKGKTIFLSGALGESGLMRITSLITLPTHALEASGGATADAAAKTPAVVSPSDPEKLVLETTQTTTSPSTI